MDDITLDPAAGFAIKTVLVQSTKSPARSQGTKVFVNVCTDAHIPEPEDGYGDELIERVKVGHDWIVPIVVSEERNDRDKAGRDCFVWDCCIHPRVLIEAIRSAAIKSLLIDTCLELVEDRAGVQLSREYALPKLMSKGTLARTVLKVSQLQPQPLTQGISSLLLDSEPEPVNVVLPTETTKAPVKPGMIQELSSSGPEPLKYNIVELSELPDKPLRIDIYGLEEEDMETIEVAMESNRLAIQVDSTHIPLPKPASRLESMFTRDTQMLHIIVWS